MRHATRAAGEVLLTAGLVGLLFIGYLIWGTGLRAASAQRALAGELNQQWQRPGGRGDAFGARAEHFDVATGQPFAFIKIPAFGQQWRFTLIQGTALAQLNQSPGHVLITLITCDPAWTGTHRVIVTGVLVAAKPR